MSEPVALAVERRFPPRSRPSYARALELVVRAEQRARDAEARAQDATERMRDLAACVRDELADADEAVLLGCFAVHVLCRREAEQPHDAAAERRVLGAMLLGRATMADVDGLETSDFYAPGHAILFAAIWAAAQGCSLPLGPRRRAVLEPVVAWVAARLPGGEEAARVVLPWPAACPREEIATVRALGRWRRGER